MKKTLFLTHILAAVIACSSFAHAVKVEHATLAGNDYRQVSEYAHTFTFDVTGLNNWLEPYYDPVTVLFENPTKIVDGELRLEKKVSIAPLTPGESKWEMGANSRLALGGSEASLDWFNITGQSVVFDDGVINLLENQAYTLGGNVGGTARVCLKDKSRLDLNGKTLSNPVYLSGAPAISNGTVSGNLTLQNGASFTWSSNDLYISGTVTLEDNSQLDLNGKTQAITVTLNGSATFGHGTQNGTLEVKAGKTLTLGGDLGGTGTISLANNAALNLNGKKLTKDFVWSGNFGIGNGTFDQALVMKDGQTLTLCGDLDGTGGITLGNKGTLNLGGKTLSKSVSSTGDATIGNGTQNGTLEVKAGKTLSLGGDLGGTGGVTLSNNARLNLNNHTLDKAVTMEGSATMGGGTYNGDLAVHADMELTLSGVLDGSGCVTLGDNTVLNLGGHTLGKAVTLAGSATIDGGTLNGALTVGAGKTLTLGGNLNGDGGVTLENGAVLNLGNTTLEKAVTLAGSATIGGGTLNSALTVGAGKTLTLVGNLNGDGGVTLGDNATLNLGHATLGKAVALTGSATIGNGTLNSALTVEAGKKLTLSDDLFGTGGVSLSNDSTLDLDGNILSKDVTVSGDATINGGTHNGALSVDAGKKLTLSSALSGTGGVSLSNNSTLDLDGNTLSKDVTVSGDATINGGTHNGALTVGAGKTLTLGGNLEGEGGAVMLGDNAKLNLGNQELYKAVTLDGGSASIGNGKLINNLTVGAGKTLTLLGNLGGEDGSVILGDNATLDLGNAELDKAVSLEGSATIGNGTIAGTLTVDCGKTLALNGDPKAPLTLNQLDVQNGHVTVTGAAEAKVSIGSLKALEETTIRLVHTNATTAGDTVYNGNLVIGEGSTVTAGSNDGWGGAYHDLTILKGGKLDLGDHSWKFTMYNNITLAGGEIAGVGGLLDFCGGANVVMVTEDSTFSTAVRVRAEGSDSLAFDVAEGKELAFSGDIVSFGQFNDNKATVYKRGAGTVVMSGSNAMTNGTIVVEAGTLKVTGGANPLGSGTVKVMGGATLNLDGEVSGTGSVILGESGPQGGDAVLELGGHTLDRAVTLEGSATIGNGTLNGIVKVKDGKTLSLGGNLQGTADIAIDGGAVQLGNNTWAKSGTGQAGTGELYSMQGIGEAKGSISGHAKADAAGLTGAGEANRVQVQGMILSTKSNFTLSHADIGGSLIDVGKGTTMYLVDVNIRPDTRLTDDAAVLNMKDTRGWLEKDVNTSVIGTETLGDETTLLMCGNNSEAITLSAGSTGVNLSCDMFNYVTLDGTNLWLDMTDIAQKNTFKDRGFFTLMFDSMDPAQEGAKALVNTGNLSVTVQLDGASYTTEAYYNSDELEGGYAPRLYFVLPAGPEPVPVPVVREVNSSEQITDPITGVDIIAKVGEGTASIFSSALMEYSGSVEVREGALNIMNVDEETKLNVANVTIATDATLGVYKGETETEANEGSLTVTGGHKLTAGKDARLNANLVMGGGVEAPAVLDVSANLGDGGLDMGSTVTLNPGSVLLSDDDMDAIGALDFMGKYDLFNGVDGLSVDGTTDFLSELGLADKWVKAADVFANDLFQSAEKEYYLFYSGVNRGGVGGNVGTVYLMQVPEPATSTLSLLALAALAARRRK